MFERIRGMSHDFMPEICTLITRGSGAEMSAEMFAPLLTCSGDFAPEMAQQIYDEFQNADLERTAEDADKID